VVLVGVADGLGAVAGACLGEDPVDVGFEVADTVKDHLQSSMS
jgi:hypothetical protein